MYCIFIIEIIHAPIIILDQNTKGLEGFFIYDFYHPFLTGTLSKTEEFHPQLLLQYFPHPDYTLGTGLYMYDQ